METTSADSLNSRFHTGLLMKVRFFWDPDFPSLDTTSRYFGSTCSQRVGTTGKAKQIAKWLQNWTCYSYAWWAGYGDIFLILLCSFTLRGSSWSGCILDASKSSPGTTTRGPRGRPTTRWRDYMWCVCVVWEASASPRRSWNTLLGERGTSGVLISLLPRKVEFHFSVPEDVLASDWKP